MAVQSFDAFVLDFSDPSAPNFSRERSRVNSTISFEVFLNDHIRTLSTNTVTQGADVEGLLYVPFLHQTDPCTNASVQYIPQNVTRITDLPSIQYTYVAFAPWFSAACTKSYLAAARAPSAFLFYVPDNGTDTPPPMNDKTWDLDDGAQWKTNNQFPVYAIPGSYGASIMQALSQYSGNISLVKNGPILEKHFDPTDYIRLYASFGSAESSSLPTLWGFLLIVLGIILILIAATSLSMHFIQGRARRSLQRRLQSGEVDLESLGITKQHLPQSAIDALPLLTYTPDGKKPPLPLPTTSVTTSPPPTTTPAPTLSPESYDQPRCPICLDDYLPHATSVRSLPCHHIYHPTCIDPFLLNNSSLCPVCKTKVLPPPTNEGRYNGEPVTNAMVRREKRMRRLREIREGAVEEGGWGWRRLGLPATGLVRGARIGGVGPGAPTQGSRSIEMREVRGDGVVSAGVDPAVSGNAQVSSEVVGADVQTMDSGEEEDEGASGGGGRWRRVFTHIFPGFR